MRTSLAGLVLGVLLVSASCGPGAISPEDPLTDPTPAPSGTQPGMLTVTGVLADGVEQGCLLLETGAETLLLLGASPGQAHAGARVTVTGTRSPGLLTTCQQGTPFRVRDLRPATD